jgi:dihydrofolate reductase
MPRTRRIEGYAIVSEDGMLANAAGIMPDSLKFAADRRFFESGLDGVDVVVHGRHSHERQPHSYLRRRLILTRQVPAVAADPSNEKALFWNPAGASFEQALAVLETPDGIVGVIGGTEVFGIFLDRYDVFHLSRAPDVRLPGGRPVFPEVPTRTGAGAEPTASTGASNSLIRQKAWRSLAGNVRRTPTDKAAGVAAASPRSTASTVGSRPFGRPGQVAASSRKLSPCWPTRRLIELGHTVH